MSFLYEKTNHSDVRILVFGAGALGSFVGGMLSQKNDVVLIGRGQHVDIVNKNGLTITGKTEIVVHPLISLQMLLYNSQQHHHNLYLLMPHLQQ